MVFAMLVTIYSKPGCHLCEDVLDILDRLASRYALEVREVNILEDMAVYDAYHTLIPVVEVGNGQFGRLVAPIYDKELRGYLDMARREVGKGSAPVPVYKESGIDKFASWVGRHWLRLVCITLGIFVGLPWLAPVFAWLGWWDLANPIYTAYALTCHQLPERAGTLLGYQVAFCYRNTALYAGIALFGVFYGLARDRNVKAFSWLNKALPVWLFALLVLPMVADGVTHMLGLRDAPMGMGVDSSFGSFYVGSQVWSLNWWLRILTGGLAALGLVWFSFPRMDRAVGESEALRQSLLTSSRRVPTLNSAIES